jgi:hypothetical protein
MALQDIDGYRPKWQHNSYRKKASLTQKQYGRSSSGNQKKEKTNLAGLSLRDRKNNSE